MKNTTTTLLVISALIFNLYLSISTVDASTGGTISNLAFLPVTGGTISDFIGEDLEFDLDSEINRRLLATRRRYISYGALSRNTVPCSRRGASYYNCRQGGQANPYNRGCSAITRCRR
ncbi:Rapid ALkalinization Factor [Heracleum sosnowskyi]|uniref:Rapid ALkalinization Factor n=1 Tax=Heracleum sosnowskyi TaxID=360622 RepID=A0AAD8IKH3_9APIA|nr:Rapid ALkalinization Factor [Heracleum sosnowskyi]